MEINTSNIEIYSYLDNSVQILNCNYTLKHHNTSIMVSSQDFPAPTAEALKEKATPRLDTLETIVWPGG